MPDAIITPFRVLVVEHDPGVRDLLQAFLTSDGYGVLLVASPQQALPLLDTRTFHVILTDLFRAADQDLFEAIEPLRSQAHPIPVGVISGWKVTEKEVLQRGFACLVLKPFDLEMVLTTIAACLHISLNAEQARQAQIIQAYFAALSARKWEAMLALCTEDVVYSLPGTTPFAGTIRGKSAFRAYTEDTFGHFPDVQFEEVQVYRRPHGMAARYCGRWGTPEGGEASASGAVLFEFDGEQITHIGIQLGEKQRKVQLAPSERSQG